MNLVRVTLALVAVVAFGPGADSMAEDFPIDRWLVAEAVPSDSSDADPLFVDHLSAPGEVGVLPDRGAEIAGVAWRLLRHESGGPVSLGSVEPGTVVYAHSYLESPADRTVRIEWRGPECATGRAWLNGRPVSRSAGLARIGAGWNTVLLKFVAGSCPVRFEVRIGADRPGSLDGVRDQASRPPGDVRTGPDDWVIAEDTALVGSSLRWRGDRLYAGVEIGLTGWGRAPVSGVEVELRSGPGGKAVAPWLVPGTVESVVIPVRLDQFGRLREKDADGRVNVRAKWNDEEVDREVVLVGDPPGRGSGIVMDGWSVKAAGGVDDGARGARLPNGGGWILEGEWKVPDALAGRTLSISADGAPAEFRLNATAATGTGGNVVLCAPCARGDRLRISATSTAAWTALPGVLVGPTAGS